MEHTATPSIIVAFDFDDTITNRDTLFDFTAFFVGKTKLIIGILLLCPILLAFKFGLLSNTYAKQKMLSFFLKGRKQSDLEQSATNYADRIDQIVNPKALHRIKWHQAEGHKVIIISASLSAWIEPWAKRNGIDVVLATELEVLKGQFTGKFSSPNCHGQEKANRLLAAYPHRNSYTLYAYGDSDGDAQLLALADYPFFRKFN